MNPFYYIYWDTSSRNIHFNKSGWANRRFEYHLSYFSDCFNWCLYCKTTRNSDIKIRYIKFVSKQNSYLRNNVCASIAIAALLLIMPGFLTDSIGFLLLIPLLEKSYFPLL